MHLSRLKLFVKICIDNDHSECSINMIFIFSVDSEQCLMIRKNSVALHRAIPMSTV